jgi:hypothetical protein
VFRRRPVSLALVGLFLWVTGCQSYKQIPPYAIEGQEKVRVTLADGEREIIRDPVIESDSLRGWQGERSGRSNSRRTEVAYSVDQVVSVSAPSGLSGGAKAAIIGVSIVVFVVGAFAIACSIEPCELGLYK